jgi:hypothetical protein
MDSYNRGYGQGVILNRGDSTTNQNEAGRWLGNATVIAQNITAAAQTAGFYALAYDMTGMANGGAFADGETVIAFRGTNFALGPSFFESPAWTDMKNGWTVGAGNTGFSSFSSAAGRQGRLAIEFYRAVSQSLGSSDPRSSNITSTGHSLGGGLAGLVSGLYLQAATVFDHMPFEGAIDNIEASSSPAVKNAVYGGLQPWASDLSGINALATSGEILAALDRIAA